MCGLNFESHAFGLILALALLALIFLDCGIRFLRNKEVWLAGGGLAAGLLVRESTKAAIAGSFCFESLVEF